MATGQLCRLCVSWGQAHGRPTCTHRPHGHPTSTHGLGHWVSALGVSVSQAVLPKSFEAEKAVTAGKACKGTPGALEREKSFAVALGPQPEGPKVGSEQLGQGQVMSTGAIR